MKSPSSAMRIRQVSAWLGLVVLACATPAGAQSIGATLTKSYQSGNTCTGCGPFGTITVTTITADEVQISLTLSAGELFAFGGAGYPLLFDISGNPQITSFQMVTTPTNATAGEFSFSQAPPVIMADGTGTWNDAVKCTGCANGTSGNIGGTLTFNLTASSAISPASFVANGNSLYFASDIGVPYGSGSYYTGDVAAVSVAPVPEASSWALLFAGSGALALLYSGKRRRDGRQLVR